MLAEACPTRQVVNRIGDRWSLLVLYALEGGMLRFAELRRAVEGVTQKMLTQTLRLLERASLVRREVFASVPPHVEYSLTPLGHSLSGRIAAIREWAYASMADIESARHDFDAAVTRVARTAGRGCAGCGVRRGCGLPLCRRGGG